MKKFLSLAMAIPFVAVLGGLSGILPTLWWEKHRPEVVAGYLVIVVIGLIFLQCRKIKPLKPKPAFPRMAVITFEINGPGGCDEVEVWVIRLTEVSLGRFLSPLPPNEEPKSGKEVVKELRRGMRKYWAGEKNSLTKKTKGLLRKKVLERKGTRSSVPAEYRKINTVNICAATRLAAILTLVVFVASACGPTPMNLSDMYKVPMPEGLPQASILVTYVANPSMAIADSDKKGKAIGWPGILVAPDGSYTEEPGLLREIGGVPHFVYMLPYDLASKREYRFFVADHAMKRLANHAGEILPLRTNMSGRKLDIKKYGDFLPTLGVLESQEFVAALEKGTQLFEGLNQLIEKMGIHKVADLKYARGRYGVIGSNLTPEMLEQVAKDDKIVSRLKKYLGKDWQIFFTIPVTSSTGLGGMILFSKLMKAPGDLFSVDTNRPGYMDAKASREDVYYIVVNILKKLGVDPNNKALWDHMMKDLESY
ncbi:MAG: hypothetical protein WC715_04800 [Patescibacteria group bacterium]|jgi:hypothetical protein